MAGVDDGRLAEEAVALSLTSGFSLQQITDALQRLRTFGASLDVSTMVVKQAGRLGLDLEEYVTRIIEAYPQR